MGYQYNEGRTIFDEFSHLNVSSSRLWQLRNPEKYRAQWKARLAVKKGLIAKKPCEVCGNEKSQMHHDDYNKPYEVRWFCQKHHNNHHAAKRKV